MQPMLLKEPDVCTVLSLSRSTIRKLMTDGRLPYFHVGRSIRFHICDVEALVEEFRAEAGGSTRNEESNGQS